MKLLIALIIATSNVTAAVFKVNEDKIEFQSPNFMLSDLMTTYASLEKMNIVFDSDYKDTKIVTAGPQILEKTALVLYVTTMLSQNQYMMRILPDTTTLSIFSLRDIRYKGSSPFSDLSNVPDTYEYVHFMYQLKHIDGKELERNLRPFVGRYGRIIDHTNNILISDSGKSVRRLIQIIKELDTLEHVRSTKEVLDLNLKNKVVTEKKLSLLEILNNNNIIFLFLFSLVGMVIGFGIRGYAMKRIEGGW